MNVLDQQTLVIPGKVAQPWGQVWFESSAVSFFSHLLTFPVSQEGALTSPRNYSSFICPVNMSLFLQQNKS